MRKEAKVFAVLFLFLMSIVMVQSVNLPVVSDFPAVGSSNWGNPLLRAINQSLDTFRVLHTENGTLKDNLDLSFNEVNASLIRGELANGYKYENFSINYDLRADRWVLLNFTSAYDSRLDRFSNTNFSALYNSDSSRFNDENFTADYDERNDRFSNSNYSTLENSAFRNENFTGNYDVRADRFSIGNYTVLENSAFRVENGTALKFSNYQEGNFTGQIDGYLPSFFNLGNYSTEYTSSGFKLGNLTSGGGSGSAGKAVCWKTAKTLGFCSNQPDVNGDCTCN